VSDFADVNFFRDRGIQDDPYPYFDWVRAQHPVWQEPHYGVYLVTGYEEALGVYTGVDRFSSCNTVAGPFVKFSEPVEGDDITDLIERCRDELPFSDQLPSFDPPRHTDHRSLLLRLITPKRLAENEEFMWRFADQLLDPVLERGTSEFIHDYAEPFTMLVVADLEGVPEEDHGLFRERLSKLPGGHEHKPLEFLYDKFSEYIEERRQNPRDDVMGGLAAATFPDGSTPEVKDAALIAANLFAGGQETTVRLLSFALKTLGERPDLQAVVREHREKIPNFLEEVLRMESPLRGQFRMAKVTTELAGVPIPAGATVLLLPGAANRDPRTFEDPHTFDVDRRNARQHMAFGFGAHTCAGAPLARAEGKVTLNRLFDRTMEITLADQEIQYLPTYFLRGLTKLQVDLVPAA
jgi:cytochrome P450 family 150 subfamily A5